MKSCKSNSQFPPEKKVRKILQKKEQINDSSTKCRWSEKKPDLLFFIPFIWFFSACKFSCKCRECEWKFYANLQKMNGKKGRGEFEIRTLMRSYFEFPPFTTFSKKVEEWNNNNVKLQYSNFLPKILSKHFLERNEKGGNSK